MVMSPENRAAASERMKAMLAKKRAAKSAVDPSLQEAMAKTTSVTMPRHPKTEELQTATARGKIQVETVEIVGQIKFEDLPNHIVIEVDWEHLPMPEAQQLYAHLKDEFEKAGKILNARENRRNAGYTCFTCKQYFEGLPHFVDYSYIDPSTGLNVRVECCRDEHCSREYHEMRIRERTKAHLREAAEQRGE